jgi:hypothetical protein
MPGFTKLWSETVTSSIWSEDDKTRIVWITLLAIVGPDGIVRASIGGLAHTARVSREACERAISIFEAPDPDSRSMENEGRRIKRVDGGFLILNYAKYRDARSHDERAVYMTEYMREYRRKQKCKDVNVNTVNGKLTLASLAKEEGEEEGEEEGRKHQPADTKDMDFAGMEPDAAFALLEREHPDIDVRGEFYKLKALCQKNGNKPTWRSFLGWLRKASPVAKIPPRRVVRTEQEEEPCTLEQQAEYAAELAKLKTQMNGNKE